MAQQFKNYINGEWVGSSSGAYFENINPATGEVIGLFPKSTRADADQAIAAAVKALNGWRKMPAPKRGEILFRAGEILMRRKEELARQMTEEMGKVLKETRGDVQEAIDMTYYMAGEGRRFFGETTPSELPDKFAMSVRMPIGVVAAITPWNFPMAIPSWKIMPALIAGNTIVFKPSRFTPHSAYNLVEILAEAGLPPGVTNLVFGEAEEVGDPLIEDPRVALISFTGSTQVGNDIAVRATKLGKRVSLEMGGKNAIMVMADADLDLAVEGIIWSAFGTSGQRCTAASRIIVERPVVEEIKEKIIARARALRLGNGLEEGIDMGPVINEGQLKRVERYVAVGKEEGAELLTGGRRVADGPLAKGYFFEPTVFGSVKPNMRIAQEEVFGPFTAIIPVDTLEEAIAVNNATPYGLSSAIYTRDVNRAFRAIENVTTGILYVNAGTIGAEIHLPFGGTRGTGNGHREAGQAALEVFSEWKVVYVDYSGKLQKAQIID